MGDINYYQGRTFLLITNRFVELISVDDYSEVTLCLKQLLRVQSLLKKAKVVLKMLMLY